MAGTEAVLAALILSYATALEAVNAATPRSCRAQGPPNNSQDVCLLPGAGKVSGCGTRG